MINGRYKFSPNAPASEPWKVSVRLLMSMEDALEHDDLNPFSIAATAEGIIHVLRFVFKAVLCFHGFHIFTGIVCDSFCLFVLVLI